MFLQIKIDNAVAQIKGLTSGTLQRQASVAPAEAQELGSALAPAERTPIPISLNSWAVMVIMGTFRCAIAEDVDTTSCMNIDAVTAA